MLFFLARIANQVVRAVTSPSKLVKAKTGLLSYDVPMRCWPIDMDAFMHMNNACYVRVAELARWAIFVQSKTLDIMKKGILFLVVEQKITYLKPINPFARYYVSNAVTFSENKWIHYRHTFQSLPSDSTVDPVIYAIVDVKAVLKEKTGKTVRTDQLVEQSEFYKQMMVANNSLTTKSE